MSYVINYSGGTITIPLNTANTTGTSLTLVGRNWTSANIQQGYGQALNQNFVSLLENFAAPSQPTSPLKGQFWYDTTTDEMKLNDGTPSSPTWATMYSTSSSITGINNGTSGVDIPVIDGNVNISSGGTANVLVVTPTGANVFGTLTSNGQVTGSTIRSTISDGSTPPLTVASSIKVDNLNADLLDGYHASNVRNTINAVVVRNAASGIIDNDINGNIDGDFGNITTINSTSLNAATIAGAITTASQPNITSVGTLTTLTSSGTITAPTFVGNLTGNATRANTVTTASQPNITSVGTLTGITSTGVVNFVGSSNVALGPVGNVQITGGTSGQYLQTNGSGALVWATIGTSGISNGSSNIDIPVASGNVNTSVGGTANVFVVTSTGVNVAGTMTATGNISGGNLVTTGNISGDNLTLTGNLSSGSITAANITATGNISGGNLSTTGNLTVNGDTDLGLVGNVTITGGTSGQVLTTNGSGALSWTTVGTSGVANGTSNISIPVAGGNVNTSVGGNANVFVVTGTGANITGTLNATGNITGANLDTAGVIVSTGNITGGNLRTAGSVTASRLISNVATGTAPFTVTSTTQVANLNVATSGVSGTVTTAAQPNITSVGTLTSLAVSGSQTVGGNITVTGQTRTTDISTGGTATAGSMTGNWTLTVGSRLQSTYADLAEYYVIDRAAGVATVVEFGGSQEIRVCNTVMSRAVAGVVSSNPAFIMNESGSLPGQIREAVALQGRVPCKVIGPASKGDMMVSAGNGAAMRCDDPVVGSVIGKSLEDKTTADLAIIEIAVGRL